MKKLKIERCNRQAVAPNYHWLTLLSKKHMCRKWELHARHWLLQKTIVRFCITWSVLSNKSPKKLFSGTHFYASMFYIIEHKWYNRTQMKRWHNFSLRLYFGRTNYQEQNKHLMFLWYISIYIYVKFSPLCSWAPLTIEFGGLAQPHTLRAWITKNTTYNTAKLK